MLIFQDELRYIWRNICRCEACLEAGGQHFEPPVQNNVSWILNSQWMQASYAVILPQQLQCSGTCQSAALWISFTSYTCVTWQLNRPHGNSNCNSQPHDLKSGHESWKGARHQDRQANWPSVAEWLGLLLKKVNEVYIIGGSMQCDTCSLTGFATTYWN